MAVWVVVAAGLLWWGFRYSVKVVRREKVVREFYRAGVTGRRCLPKPVKVRAAVAREAYLSGVEDAGIARGREGSRHFKFKDDPEAQAIFDESYAIGFASARTALFV